MIQEAGLDGFWIHRLLQDEGVESHVVDTGSPGAVARPRLPQNVACGFPAPRSSTVGSQHREALQGPIGKMQFRSR